MFCFLTLVVESDRQNLLCCFSAQSKCYIYTQTKLCDAGPTLMNRKMLRFSTPDNNDGYF